MSLRFYKAQLKAIQTLAVSESLEAERKLQERVGVVMQRMPKTGLRYTELSFSTFKSTVITPESCECQGGVLYLHGGGYCCGGVEYAKGFGAALAAAAGVRAYCPAYRLAPEQPFPAALQDAVTMYRLLLETYPAEKLVLVGESAGGGLCYALCLKLRELELPLPALIITCSPWTDLTSSGMSYKQNEEIDPSMTAARLQRYAKQYAGADLTNPYVSPLFGDLRGLPESLIFVGGDEIMLDDAVTLHGRLLSAGCKSSLTVAPELWHGYVLYQLKQRKQDMEAITASIRRVAL